MKYIHCSTATIFGRNVAKKVGNQNIIFAPHLTNDSALPGETANPEIVPFHLNATWFLPKNTTQT